VVVALGSIAVAGTSSMGIHGVSRVRFVARVKVGTVDLPAGEYVVRHTMVGHAHVMVCLRVHSKGEFEVKCTLVPLTQKADKDQSIYLSAAMFCVVLAFPVRPKGLVFRGDTAKRVF
jgi:hypothetical protein